MLFASFFRFYDLKVFWKMIEHNFEGVIMQWEWNHSGMKID